MSLISFAEGDEVRAARATARQAMAAEAHQPEVSHAGVDRLAAAGLLDAGLPIEVALAVAEECGRCGHLRLVPGDLPKAAALAGTAASLLDTGAGYASQRAAFGRPLARFQVQRHAFALCAARLAASRALTWRAARYGAELDLLAALPEAAEAAWLVAETVLQVHGGTGYADGEVSRRWQQVAGERARVRAALPGT